MQETLPEAPPEFFNIAQYLLGLNADRAGKSAFVDDFGSTSYGELADRVRRMAASLRNAGIRREERVFLVMPDCREWPVCFLGAIYAGCVPVAVNTLLTADDYAYMLAHSRARAVITAPALLPTLTQALERSKNEVQFMLAAGAESDSRVLSLDTLLDATQPLDACAPTRADEPAFRAHRWIGSGSHCRRGRRLVRLGPRIVRRP